MSTNKFNKDTEIIRENLRELLSNNKEVQNDIAQQFKDGDFSLLEEYATISKGIIDASKLLIELNEKYPKTLKEYNEISNTKEKIKIEDLLD